MLLPVLADKHCPQLMKSVDMETNWYDIVGLRLTILTQPTKTLVSI